MSSALSVVDMKAHRITASEAREKGFVRISAGFSATSEMWMLQNAAALLDESGIEWCVVKKDGYVYLGRQGAKMPDTWDDSDQNPDGWDGLGKDVNAKN